MPQARRVIQEDVARLAGVNRATVSLALRGHRSIPPRTSAKIRRIADKLGYSPDPLLTALANYRHSIRSATFHGTLAWLANTCEAHQWRNHASFSSYFTAARRRCLRYGYKLEVVDVGELKISWERAATLMGARGIQGVLLCPQPEPNTNLTSFPWERFSAVTFGYTLVRPRLHTVAAAHYCAVLTTIDQLRLRGYRRIGFTDRRSHDQRINHNMLAAYLAACQSHPELARIEPFMCEDWPGKGLHAWTERERIDALVSCDPEFHKRLPTQPFGVAIPMLFSSSTPMAGILERDEQIGETAADFLVSMVQRGETGVPGNPQQLLIEGTWLEGKSLRPSVSESVVVGA